MPIGEEGKYIGMHIGRPIGKSAPGSVGKEKKGAVRVRPFLFLPPTMGSRQCSRGKGRPLGTTIQS